MSKISNCFTMLELLTNGRKYSLKELSERLEVGNRMIRVYKEDLEKAGIYIDTLRGPYGGYVLNQNILLPTRGFSKYDVELLKYIYKKIDKNDGLLPEYQNLIDKIEGKYKSSKKKSKIKLEGDKKDKYNTLSKAIKEKRKVLIDFLLPDGTSKERIIHPCDMFLYNDDWHVSAFCELRGEIRHFRLNRIKSHELLKETYKI